jgi:hypothetical protein
MRYLFAVADDNWAGRTLEVKVGTGLHPDVLELNLVKGTLLHGQVATEPKGKPFANQSVLLVESTNAILELRRWARTDEEGRFRLRIGPGSYVLTGPEGSGSRNFSVPDGEEATHEELFHVQKPATVTLTGRLTNAPMGLPLDAFEVHGLPPIYELDPNRRGLGPRFEISPDETGRFKVERGEGAMWVLARHPTESFSAFAEIAEKADKVELKVGAAPCIKGRLLDDQGKPWTNARLSCSIRLSANESQIIDHAPNGLQNSIWAPAIGIEAQTNAKGEFVIPSLAPKLFFTMHVYKVMALKPDERPRPYACKLLDGRIEDNRDVKLGDVQLKEQKKD